MKISILCTDPDHPIYPHLETWCKRMRGNHAVELVKKKQSLSGGDLLFLISCHELVSVTDRSHYRKSLVVHASDLPRGRGWSPLVWQIVEGRSRIVVTLLEAADPVDSGDIWSQETLYFQGHELVDEINSALFGAELALMDFGVAHFGTVIPKPQPPERATYYRQRTAEDSRIDPTRPLIDQFNLLRIADPQRYPAFFEHLGQRYAISLRKLPLDDNH